MSVYTRIDSLTLSCLFCFYPPMALSVRAVVGCQYIRGLKTGSSSITADGMSATLHESEASSPRRKEACPRAIKSPQAVPDITRLCTCVRRPFVCPTQKPLERNAHCSSGFSSAPRANLHSRNSSGVSRGASCEQTRAKGTYADRANSSVPIIPVPIVVIRDE